MNEGKINEGKAYIKNCMGNGNFKFFAFIKIAEGNAEDVANGLEDVFSIFKAEGSHIPRAKIVIPICKELGSAEIILRKVLTSIEGVTKLKRVILTTMSPDCYSANIEAYSNVYKELINECKISLE
jgi:hypothetical protein